MQKIIFMSGIHGVGKTTLCEKIQRESGLNNYSCSDLIKNNSSYVENTKAVRSSQENQEVLISSLGSITEDRFLLDGHFCLIGSDNSIIEIEDQVFREISPYAIINVSCDVAIVHQRLIERDGNAYSLELLDSLQKSEIDAAVRMSEALKAPLYCYGNGDSINELILFLNSI